MTARIAVLLATLICSVASSNAADRFRVASLDGKAWVQPGHFNGKPSVFLFWDTECSPCLKELSDLHTLQAAFPDAVLVAVSLSPRADTRRVLATLNLPHTLIHARAPGTPQGLLASLGNRYGALPFSAAFRANGEQCAHGLGALTAATLSAAAGQCAHTE